METLIYLLKVSSLLSGAFLLYQQRFLAGIALLEIGLFIAGASLSIDSESPFTFLLSESATSDDYTRAIFGGAHFCTAISFLSIWMFGQFAKTINSKDN